MSAEEKIA